MRQYGYINYITFRRYLSLDKKFRFQLEENESVNKDLLLNVVSLLIKNLHIVTM